MIYYHVTNVLNHEKIMNEGIKPNESGEIFVMDNLDCSAMIAYNQLFLKDFALYSLEWEEDVEEDKVAELTAKHQFIIKTQKPLKANFKGFFKIVKVKQDE